MRLLTRHILVLALLFGMTSCLIENDMAYPNTPAEITAFEVEGQKSVKIDVENRSVEVVLEETADIKSLKVNVFQLNAGASVVGKTPQYLDLSAPVTMALKVYKECTWTITAIQPIDRYIVVENQVEEASFDDEDKFAVVYVTEFQPLNSVVFVDAKFEADGSEIVSTTGYEFVGNESSKKTEDCVFPMTLDCVMLRTFTVRRGGEDIEWTVRLQKKKIGLQIMSVNAFSRRAEIKAGYDGQGSPVLEYRKASETEWTVFEESVVAAAGLSGVIEGLEPDTDYLVRVTNGGNHSAEYPFRTEAEAQLYNMNFDEWWLDGKVWYPYAQGADPTVWDSANKGSAGFGFPLTDPEENFIIAGKAVRMESKYAVIAFAAGNLYTGRFGAVDAINGGASLEWGVPFASRPKSLRGYYSYAPKPIDKVNVQKLAAGGLNAEAIRGSMDKCQIQVILADWDEPFQVNTTKGQFVDIENDPHIIAHGKIESDEATDGYREFVIDLEYRDTERTPKYVVISACASYLGDYFTGAVGSTMYVDEFEFVY